MSRRTTFHPSEGLLRRRKAKKPVHPKDRYWYSVGFLHGKDKRRSPKKFLDERLPLREQAGGSYTLRYRDMYTLGFNEARNKDG